MNADLTPEESIDAANRRVYLIATQGDRPMQMLGTLSAFASVVLMAVVCAAAWVL